MTPKDSAELANALFQEAGDALFLLDPESNAFLDVNPTALRLTEFTLDELRGQSAIWLFRFDQGGVAQLQTAYRKSGIFHAQDGYLMRTAKEGVWIPVSLTIARLHLKDRTLALITARDDRERRAAIEQMRRLEEEQRRLLQALPDAVWSAVREAHAGPLLDGWVYAYTSSMLSRFAGRPETMPFLVPQRWWEQIHPDDRLQFLRRLEDTLRSTKTDDAFQYRVVGIAGTTRWIQERIQISRDMHGRPLRMDGVAGDITTRIRAESALRESELRLSRIVETNTNGILLLDLQGKITFVNRAAERILGRPREALIGSDWNALPWADSDNERLQPIPRTAQDLAQTLYGHEHFLTALDGRRLILSLNAALIRDDSGQMLGVVVSFSDITLRREAEEALRLHQERLTKIVETVADGLLLVDHDEKIIFANTAAERLFALSRQRLMLLNWTHLNWFPAEFVPDEADDYAVADLVLKRGEMIQGVIRFIPRSDGSRKLVSCSFVPLRDVLGRPTGMVISLTDITQRKLAEDALAQQNHLWHSLIDSVPDLIFTKDWRGAYLGCNPAYELLTGMKERDLLGRTDAEVFPDELLPFWNELQRQVLGERRPARREDWLKYRDGRQARVEILLTPLIGADRELRGLIGIGRDLTDRKRLEDQLRQAGKLEAIGLLAGGIAHDFNNLLTVILGNLHLVRNGPPNPSAADEYLLAAEKAAKRAAELTSQLLGFARRTALKTEPIDLRRTVEETIGLLRHLIDPRIVLESKLPEDLWLVEADQGQMQQVLLNLCLNARDAMPEGGFLRLHLCNRTFDDNIREQNLDAQPGEYVEVLVEDTGHGMDEATIARIYEPFFTTKELGKGTGLGLAMVFGIIRSHHGWIECRSRPGVGTTFTLYLPRALGSIPTAIPIAAKPSGGRETILLVDDEPLVRELGRVILAEYGYTILEAGDGEEALEIVRTCREPIDLVVLDQTMPRMNGSDCLRELRRLRPDLPILCSSGYAGEEMLELFSASYTSFIHKPFQPDALADAVRALLDAGVVK